MCAEAFSAMLQQAEEGTIQGVQICRGAPKINHLFFADDSLIVMKANVQGAAKLQQILAFYMRSKLAKKINKDKSTAGDKCGNKSRCSR